MNDKYTDVLQDRFGEMRLPVTILWGKDDAWIPVEEGRKLSARIPHAELRVVDGAGHLVREDRPEAVVATVLEVLTAQDS